MLGPVSPLVLRYLDASHGDAVSQLTEGSVDADVDVVLVGGSLSASALAAVVGSVRAGAVAVLLGPDTASALGTIAQCVSPPLSSSSSPPRPPSLLFCVRCRSTLAGSGCPPSSRLTAAGAQLLTGPDALTTRALTGCIPVASLPKAATVLYAGFPSILSTLAKYVRVCGLACGRAHANLAPDSCSASEVVFASGVSQTTAVNTSAAGERAHGGGV